MGMMGPVVAVMSFIVTVMYWVAFMYNDFRYTSMALPAMPDASCQGEGSGWTTTDAKVYLSWGYWGYCMTKDSGGLSDDNMKCVRKVYGQGMLGWDSNYDSTCLSYYDSSLGLGPDQWVPFGFGLTALIFLTCGSCALYPLCCIGDEHAMKAMNSAVSFNGCAGTCLLVAISCETAFNNRGGFVRGSGPEANDLNAGYSFIGSWVCYVLLYVTNCTLGAARKSAQDECGDGDHTAAV